MKHNKRLTACLIGITAGSGCMQRVILCGALLFASLDIAQAGWHYLSVSSRSVNNDAYSFAIGAGRNDGIVRIYQFEGRGLSEYTWASDTWTLTGYMGRSPGVSGKLNISVGRNDTVNRIYTVDPYYNDASEYSWNQGLSTWTVSSIGASGLIPCPQGITGGDGRNDGTMRIYIAYGCASQTIREFSWNGSAWTNVIIGSAALSASSYGTIELFRTHGGLNRVYSTNATGIYEFSWNGSSFTMTVVGTSSIANGYETLRYGDLRNDGAGRLLFSYGANATPAMELSWSGSAWNKTQEVEYGIGQDVGTLYNDAVRHIVGGNNASGFTDNIWSSNQSQYLRNSTVNSLEGNTYFSSLKLSDARGDGVIRVYGKRNYGILEFGYDYLSPPAPITSTASPGIAHGQVNLEWLSPADDGNCVVYDQAVYYSTGGFAGKYVLQYSTSPTVVWSTAAAQILISTTVPYPGNVERLILSSLDYDATYYMRIWSEDVDGNLSAGSNISSSFAQGNHAPILGWTGEPNYATGGISPGDAHVESMFTYRVKYIDVDSDAPDLGYPKLHIKKNGIEIAGSPFAMSFVSGTPATGSIYTYSKVLTSTGTDYTYYLEAQDIYNAVSTGTPVVLMSGPSVTNVAPVLLWTGEANYTADGVNPGSAHSGSNFVFRVKYKDSDGDTPASGYPAVHVLKDSIEIAGSPFAMNFVSGTPATGAIYTYSKVLTSTGTDYTYYFAAQDAYSAISTGTPIVIMSGPSVTNTAPALNWTGEANYTTDGINPNTGDPTTNFIFRVKYSDVDSDAPYSGYPKLHVKKGGSEISGSPFAMSYVSGGYSSGAIYTYTTSLASSGLDYTYYFEAQDAYAEVAAGPAVNPISGPIVSNHAPVLAWTGEVEYTTSGLSPQSGDRNTNFIFRVKYSDADNQAPNAGYPKLHVKQDGAEISGSPYAMNYVSGGYTTGAIYTYTKTLTPGTNYTYYFEAQDSDAVGATGAPTVEINAPDVSNQLPVLAWTGEADYAAGGLYPINGAATDNYVFRVKYTDPDNDAPSAGCPRVHIKKTGVEIGGSPFAMSYVSGANNTGAIYLLSKNLISGDYAYSFEALDLYGGQAGGIPLSDQAGPIVIGAALPPAQEVKVYHGVFKPGENEKSQISFNTSAAAQITIKVYNTAGQMVRELFRGTSNPGLNTVSWDGKDSGGARVSSGVYVIRVEGGGINQSKRVIVVR